MLYYEELEQWENIFNNTLSPSDGMDIDTPKFCESDLHPGDADAHPLLSLIFSLSLVIKPYCFFSLSIYTLYKWIYMNTYEHI